MARLFVTGATGYIGGDVIYRLQQSSLAKSHISCLVRDVSKAKQLSGTYPNVELVQGGLGDSKLVEKEARKADVVLSLFCEASVCYSTDCYQTSQLQAMQVLLLPLKRR